MIAGRGIVVSMAVRLFLGELRTSNFAEKENQPGAASTTPPNYSFRSLSRPSSPAKPMPKHAPQAMSPTMSAPCNIWTRGLLKFESNTIVPISASIRPVNRLDFRMRSPCTRIVYVFGELVSFTAFGQPGEIIAMADILNRLAALTTADENGRLKCPASLPVEETRSALKPTSRCAVAFRLSTK
jgi:hypothetical protein